MLELNWNLPLSVQLSLCLSDPVNSQGDACASLHQPVSWYAPGPPLMPWQMGLTYKIYDYQNYYDEVGGGHFVDKSLCNHNCKQS